MPNGYPQRNFEEQKNTVPYIISMDGERMVNSDLTDT